MKRTSDDIFRDAHAIALALEATADDDPARDSLLRQQDRLRAQARILADERRHPVSVENEIAMLEHRLDEIHALFITEGYPEKHLKKGFSDPGAYSAAINRKLASDHGAEVAEIEQRLNDLRTIITDDEGS